MNFCSRVRQPLDAELAFAGIARQAELLREGSVTSTALVEGYLRRIEEIEPRLNAFRAVYRERALAEAAQADARLRAGDDRPLLGVPLAVKDNVDVAGDVTAYGTRSPGPPASADSEVVRRLRAAGAVLLGKTHLSELAIFPFGETAAWGTTLNPWQCRSNHGRLERRVGRGGRRRAGRRRPGLRRRRLDPHPRGLLPPVRHQAPARPDLALAAARALVRAHHLRAADPHGAGRRAVPRRRGGSAARRRRPAARRPSAPTPRRPAPPIPAGCASRLPQAARAHAGQRGRAASGARARRAAALARPRRERARAELRRVAPPVRAALAAGDLRRHARPRVRPDPARAPHQAHGRRWASRERRSRDARARRAGRADRAPARRPSTATTCCSPPRSPSRR